MRVVAAVFRAVIGALFGIASAFVLSPAVAAVGVEKDAGSFAGLVLVVIAVSAILGLSAVSVRRSFGRGFLLLGVSFLALPVAVMALSGRVATDMTSSTNVGDQIGTAIGASIAGAVVTTAATFVGLILGAIFVIVGLVLSLGGRREVVVIERRS